MRLRRRSVVVTSLLYLQSVVWAGSMGGLNSSFSGVWGGVGGSFTYSTLSGRTNITKVSSTPSTAEYLFNDILTNHMSPVVNIGYMYDFHNDWLAGVKILYKYIGQEEFDLTWSGSYSDGTYQSAGLRTKLVQDIYPLATAGYQFGNWFLYGGAGPSWANVRTDLNGDVLPSGSLNFTPVNTSQSKTILGGAGQVGFQYLLPMRFMVDLSYNFLATPSAMIPTINFATGSSVNYATFNQRVSVVEQGLNITLNKYF